MHDRVKIHMVCRVGMLVRDFGFSEVQALAGPLVHQLFVLVDQEREQSLVDAVPGFELLEDFAGITIRNKLVFSLPRCGWGSLTNKLTGSDNEDCLRPEDIIIVQSLMPESEFT